MLLKLSLEYTSQVKANLTINIMKDKDMHLIFEAYGDEHNPPDNPGPNSGDVYAAMDKQSSFDHIAAQYGDLDESELEARLATLKKHVDVIEYLLEMDEKERVAYQGY